MKHKAEVIDVVKETTDVKTIKFTVDGGVLPFVAGQYVAVYFPERTGRVGKSYSLSSLPSDDFMSITVKNIGHFSDMICALAAGDTFVVSQPYGFFNVRDDSPIVALAAGVGVSPIWSVVGDTLQRHNSRSVSVLLTAPTLGDLVFKNSLDKLSDAYDGLNIKYFTTKKVESGCTNRRIDIMADVKDDLLAKATFYICGSEDFVRGMWLQLMEAGVDERKIVTETFFESSL